MKPKNKTDQRAIDVEKVILAQWSSLISHLEWTYKKSAEGKTFHKKCVKQYAEEILNTTKLY